MNMRAILFFTLIGTAFAQPALKNRQLLTPSVVLKNGTVIGSTTGVVDSFKGIPFAEPPTGSLRLKPPHSITSTYGTITATGVPTACPQFFVPVDTSNLPDDVVGELVDNPLFQAATVTGEDCLTLKVQRPSTATANSKLPVLFWIFGGGFEFGSTQMYDGTPIIEQSIVLGQEIIYVAVNYRVSGFGFLAGKELQKEGSTNLGLRDQRLGLEWVQENIAAFGGDPTRVTIWGESAGSISVFDQTIINGGNNFYNDKPLFQGAIMDSGCIVPSLTVNSTPAQKVYDTVVKNAGCSTAADTLTCLRSTSYTTFLNAVNSVPEIFSYRSVDLSYFPRPDPASTFFSVSPEISVEKGAFAKVPVIIGDQEDEGTLFALFQGNISTTTELINYLSTYYPNTPRSSVATLVATYPNNPSAGSPFNTGIANEIYPQFKRLAAILGDVTFNLRRRSYLELVSSEIESWSYLASYLYGTPVLGTLHGSDIAEIYFNLPDAIPAVSIRTYYIAFVNSLNPNSISNAAPLIPWPRYNTSSRQLLNFGALSNQLIVDNFRDASGAFLSAHLSTFRL